MKPIPPQQGDPPLSGVGAAFPTAAQDHQQQVPAPEDGQLDFKEFLNLSGKKFRLSAHSIAKS